jgi:RES domain-containing protein
VQKEHNYLINPNHPDINALDIGDPEPLNPDPRLTGEE